jgi:poly-gamma-glutamate synthesis protein (capsule biosynthesis protein)
MDIGTDIVELDGDHFQDWGPEAVLYTLDLYQELGLKTYGGGRNLEEARRPLLINHNDNKFAFLGCNAKEIGYAGADTDQPGAFHCDIEWMQDPIKTIKSRWLSPYCDFPTQRILFIYSHDPQMLSDFRAMADAGAVIISGSQAHQPQSMEFYKDSFLHYGLGNLFFDQYDEGIPTRQAFIDRHVFYEGRHISTELLSINFYRLCPPQTMTEEERAELLQPYI